MSIFDSPTNRLIAGGVGLAGLVFSGLTIEAWGKPELWKFVARMCLFFVSLWLFGRALLQSRLGGLRLPRRLELWSQAYVAIVALVVLVGAVLSVFAAVVSSHQPDAMSLFALGFLWLISGTAWGAVGYVAVVLPLWGIFEAVRAAWLKSSNGDI
jgi:hypothetical protein